MATARAKRTICVYVRRHNPQYRLAGPDGWCVYTAPSRLAHAHGFACHNRVSTQGLIPLVRLGCLWRRRRRSRHGTWCAVLESASVQVRRQYGRGAACAPQHHGYCACSAAAAGYTPCFRPPSILLLLLSGKFRSFALQRDRERERERRRRTSAHSQWLI